MYKANLGILLTDKVIFMPGHHSQAMKAGENFLLPAEGEEPSTSRRSRLPGTAVMS